MIESDIITQQKFNLLLEENNRVIRILISVAKENGRKQDSIALF